MTTRPLPLTRMKRSKRILVAVVGGTVLAVGVALTVLPGPAFIVIPAGLAILAVEFACARHWLRSPRVHRCFCKIATAERFAYDPGEQTVRAVDGGCEIGSLKR